MNEIITPREFIREKLLFEINFDNESDACDFEWTIIEDLMLEYAEYYKQVLKEK